MEYPLTLIRMVTIRETESNLSWHDMEKLELGPTVGGKAKWCSYCRQQFGGSSRNKE